VVAALCSGTFWTSAGKPRTSDHGRRAATLIYNIPGHSVAQLVFIPLDFAVAGCGLCRPARAEQAEVAGHMRRRASRQDAATRVAVQPKQARIARRLHDIVARRQCDGAASRRCRAPAPDAMAEDRDALRMSSTPGGAGGDAVCSV
jgi:hypothetical protein